MRAVSFYEVLGGVKLLHVELVDRSMWTPIWSTRMIASGTSESLSIKLERERRARRDAVLAQLISLCKV